MLSHYKALKKSSKSTIPVKGIKKVVSKRPKGLGLVKEVKEKVFTPTYDYGF